MPTATHPKPARSQPRSTRRPPPRRGRRRSPMVAVAVAGVVLLLGVVAIALSANDRLDSPDTGAGIEEVRAVEVVGAGLAPFEDGGPDPAAGSPAPRVVGSSFDGTPVSIGGPGEAQVVAFVAHWCPHCRKEVPVIVDWIADAGLPAGVALRTVSTGVNEAAPNYPPSVWLEGEGWTIPTLADDAAGQAGAAYGLTGYPLFVAIGSDGAVVARASGELGVDQLETLVQAARTGHK